MLTALLMAALALGASPAAQDTTVQVSRGARLEVTDLRGEVEISTWNRNAVGVADSEKGDALAVAAEGSTIRVRPRSHAGRSDTDVRITVPEWMNVRVQGNRLDVTVTGTRGEVSVETVGGDIRVDGGAGMVSLRSIQGDVRVRHANGRVEAISVNEDVSLEDVDGDVYVETTNGDVVMQGIRSGNARATTVNGDVLYRGTIVNDGRYVFSTHNGDVTVAVPENANATVVVSTYQGDFESEFPIRLSGTSRDRQFSFTLGSGSARLELESFNGEIKLTRP